MQKILLFFLMLGPVVMLAQSHHLSADAGYVPGFSVTYHYNLVKRFSAGVGFQGYRVPRTRAHIRQFTPAIYGDVRLNIRPEKNNQFFSFLDLGINLYQQDKIDERDSTRVADISHNNGFYSGIGMGYFRRMTKRGGGPYASLKMMFNWYTVTAYSIVAEDYDMRWWSGSGSFAFSLGFKF